MSNDIIISKEQLEQMLSRILESSQKMNPMEQRKYEEEMKREDRRNKLMLELGKAEEERTARKKNGCTHKRDSKTGMDIARDQMGDWVTGGQAFQDGMAAIMCLRCHTRWIFKPTPEQYSIILQNGLLNAVPPIGQVEAS